MLNQTGVTKTQYTNVTQILFNTQQFISVSCLVDDTGVTAVDGRKIIKAGTPVSGDLADRKAAFSKAATDVVGMLMHDVDVTTSPANAACLLQGAVNLDRLEDDVKALITTGVKTDLKNIFFLSDN